MLSSSRREDLRPSIHSICSASSSHPRATSSNALFMDRSLVRAARFLASAALCRYSSDRDDMQGEHWKDASVPQIHRTLRQVRRWSVGHGRPPSGSWQPPARRPQSAGRGGLPEHLESLYVFFSGWNSPGTRPGLFLMWRGGLAPQVKPEGRPVACRAPQMKKPARRGPS